VGGLGRRDDNAARVGVKKIDWRCHSINIASIIQLRRRRRSLIGGRLHATSSRVILLHSGVARGEGKGKLPPPMGGRPKIMQYVCAFIVVELHRITRQIHCKAVEQRATLIYTDNTTGTGGTSYSRPPIDPYLTSPLLQNPGGATALASRGLVAAKDTPPPACRRRRDLGASVPFAVLLFNTLQGRSRSGHGLTTLLPRKTFFTILCF